MYENEIPGEYQAMDLLYLQEIQNQREELENEVICTIRHQIPAPNQKARASTQRGRVQHPEHTQDADDHDSDQTSGCSEKH